MSDTQLQLFASDAWDALTKLLTEQLSGVQVEQISDKDFDENGALILNPPSVRVMYVSTGFATMETQRTAYSKTHKFLVICGNDDRSSTIDQARASLVLSQRAEIILGGARIRLANNELTEPLAFVSTEPMPVNGLGVAYALAIEVPGAAGYDALNAWPAEAGGN